MRLYVLVCWPCLLSSGRLQALYVGHTSRRPLFPDSAAEQDLRPRRRVGWVRHGIAAMASSLCQHPYDLSASLSRPQLGRESGAKSRVGVHALLRITAVKPQLAVPPCNYVQSARLRAYESCRHEPIAPSIGESDPPSLNVLPPPSTPPGKTRELLTVIERSRNAQ